MEEKKLTDLEKLIFGHGNVLKIEMLDRPVAVSSEESGDWVGILNKFKIETDTVVLKDAVSLIEFTSKGIYELDVIAESGFSRYTYIRPAIRPIYLFGAVIKSVTKIYSVDPEIYENIKKICYE